MKVKKRVFLNSLKIIILSILFYVAVHFENASGDRLNILLVIFTAYIFLGLIRRILNGRDILLSLSFLLDIFLVYLLEHNSRFMINYFFHSFYIVILLEASLTIKRDKSLIIGIITVGVSLIKYILLISYRSNLANISQLAFFILVNALILIVTNFAQYNKEEKEKKDILYKELLAAHKKLKEYSEKIENLAVIEERNRIARDIHDTLGHNMTALIMQMEMSSHMIDEDINKAKELLDSAKNMARDGLVSVRRVVETLRVEEKIGETNSLKELIDGFSIATGIEIEIDIIGQAKKIKPDIDIALYRIIQEALTNAVRHGKASKIRINISYNDAYIEFAISDNGVGVEAIKEGYGLKGIKERVNKLNGQVEFYSKNGFIVKGFLPLNRSVTGNLEHRS